MAKTIPLARETEAQLLNALDIAENIRKKIVLNYSIIGTVLFAGLIIEAVTWMSIAVVIIILFVLVYTKWYGIPVTKFENTFLQQVTQNILSLVDKNLKVDFGSHLKLSDFKSTTFFADVPDYFSGKNLIYGDIDGCFMRISEIYATWQQPDSKQFPAVKGVFNGLVMITNMETNVPSALFLTTDKNRVDDALRLNTSWISGKISETVYYYGEKVPEANSAQTKYLASSFATYYAEHGKHVIAAILPSTTCVAIMNTAIHHYLKPSVFKTVYDKEAISRYYKDVLFLRNCMNGAV